MAFKAIDLPTLSMSSGGTATPAWINLDDASVIAISVSGTTAPGMQVQVELVDSGSNFKPLVIPSSGNSIVTASSSYVIQVFGGGFRQMRLGTTAASTGGFTVTGVKWVNI